MVDKVDFTMCNPPFFASKQEMMSTYEKDTDPSTACTGFEVEMVTDGGESHYVSRMVDESKVLGERCQWYTSQLGKLASLPLVIDKLKALGCKNWAVGVLNPHEKTRRWVIGWSWDTLRPKNVRSTSLDPREKKTNIIKDIARNKDVSVSQVWPTEYPILISEHTKNALADTVTSALNALSLDWSFDPKTYTGLGVARGNVWSRHARRKRKLQEMSAETPSSSNAVTAEKIVTDPTAEMEPEMVFRVSISDSLVTLRWLKGVDEVLWDSFCGMMRRKLTDNAPTVKKKTKVKGSGGNKDGDSTAKGEADAMDEGE
jgi:23S rRNA (adenine1618-N6)-methyltransferase